MMTLNDAAAIVCCLIVAVPVFWWTGQKRNARD